MISTFSTGLRLNAALPPWVRRPSLPQERKEYCTVVATCCPTVRDPTVPILFLYCSYTVPILFPLILLQINSAGFCEILQPIQTLKLPLHSSACTGTKM